MARIDGVPKTCKARGCTRKATQEGWCEGHAWYKKRDFEDRHWEEDKRYGNRRTPGLSDEESDAD